MKLTMLYRLVWNLLCSLGCPATCTDPPASASSKLEAQLHHHIPLTFSFEEAGGGGELLRLKFKCQNVRQERRKGSLGGFRGEGSRTCWGKESAGLQLGPRLWLPS